MAINNVDTENGIEKRILTRVLLKNDTSDNWGSNSTVLLKKGEAALSFIPNATNPLDPPDVMMKVGDGTHNFGQLNWLSALAADVHPWAKTNFVDFIKDYATLIYDHKADTAGPITHTTSYN